MKKRGRVSRTPLPNQETLNNLICLEGKFIPWGVGLSLRIANQLVILSRYYCNLWSSILKFKELLPSES